MSLPEETANNQPAGRKSGVIVAILLFLAIISIAIFTYMDSKDIDIRKVSIGQLASGINSGVKTAEVLYDISYDSREHPAFSIFKDYIVKCSKDGIRLLDKKGAEVWSETLPLNQPLARTNGREILVADAGGQDVYVLKEDGVIWKDTLDVTIYNADISKAGYVTLVTGSKRYNNEIRVYDTHGIELFRSIIANDFAVSARISPASNNLVVDSINTEGIKAVTNIRFLDMKGSDLGTKSLDTSESLLPSILYSESGELFTVGDRAMVCFNKDRSIGWEKKFTDVTAACLASGRKLAAVVEESAGTKLVVFSSIGKELAACPVDMRALHINTGSGLIAVSAQRDILFYNEKCRNIGKYTSKSDIIDVYFFSRQQAAVVTRNQVSIINIG